MTKYLYLPNWGAHDNSIIGIGNPLFTWKQLRFHNYHPNNRLVVRITRLDENVSSIVVGGSRVKHTNYVVMWRRNGRMRKAPAWVQDAFEHGRTLSNIDKKLRDRYNIDRDKGYIDM